MSINMGGMRGTRGMAGQRRRPPPLAIVRRCPASVRRRRLVTILAGQIFLAIFPAVRI